MKLLRRCGQFPDLAVRGFGEIAKVFVGVVHAKDGVCLVLQNELDGASDFVRSHQNPSWLVRKDAGNNLSQNGLLWKCQSDKRISGANQEILLSIEHVRDWRVPYS